MMRPEATATKIVAMTVMGCAFSALFMPVFVWFWLKNAGRKGNNDNYKQQ